MSLDLHERITGKPEVNFLNQAFSQLCAFVSPEAEILSAITIFRQSRLVFDANGTLIRFLAHSADRFELRVAPESTSLPKQ